MMHLAWVPTSVFDDKNRGAQEQRQRSRGTEDGRGGRCSDREGDSGRQAHRPVAKRSPRTSQTRHGAQDTSVMRTRTVESKQAGRRSLGEGYGRGESLVRSC